MLLRNCFWLIEVAWQARVATNTLLPVLAAECEELLLPDLNPRLRILGTCVGCHACQPRH